MKAIRRNRSSVDDTLDIGFQILDYLILRKEPVPDELLYKYIGIGSDRFKELLDKDELTLAELKEFADIYSTIKDADEVIGMISRCDPYNIPRDIISRVCRCSPSSLANYTRDILKKAKDGCLQKLQEEEYNIGA